MNCCCDGTSNPLGEYLESTPGGDKYEWIASLHMYYKFCTKEQDEARRAHNAILEGILRTMKATENTCYRLAMLHQKVMGARRLSCHRLHLWRAL